MYESEATRALVQELEERLRGNVDIQNQPSSPMMQVRFIYRVFPLYSLSQIGTILQF